MGNDRVTDKIRSKSPKNRGRSPGNRGNISVKSNGSKNNSLSRKESKSGIKSPSISYSREMIRKNVNINYNKPITSQLNSIQTSNISDNTTNNILIEEFMSNIDRTKSNIDNISHVSTI